MPKAINTNTLEYEDYKTEIFTEKNLKDFLLKEAIPCLSSRFKEPKDFYDNIISKIPKAKKHKNFKMIYTHLIHSSLYNYIPIKELLETWNLKEEDLIAEGSVGLIDVQADENGEKPLIRWIILKD